jgi:hypothetical protein
LFGAASEAVPDADVLFVQPSTTEDTNKVAGNLAEHLAKITARIVDYIESLSGSLRYRYDSVGARRGWICHLIGT